jgi:hypothetical protein
MLELTGTDITRCPRCKTGTLGAVVRVPPLTVPGAPLSVLPTEAPDSS